METFRFCCKNGVLIINYQCDFIVTVAMDIAVFMRVSQNWLSAFDGLIQGGNSAENNGVILTPLTYNNR
jgi:hypothetical protein